jgi:hypothetical protein
MDKSFFESTLQYDWDMIPEDRSFNPIAVRQYLDRLSEPDRSFVRELLDRTTYIPYAEFKVALLQSFQIFVNDIGNQEFYLVLPSGKVGSEHWLTALLWPKLRLMNLRQIISEDDVLDITEQVHVLTIDDAIYSGNNTLGKIDSLTFDMSEKLGLRQRAVTQQLLFDIVVPYVNPSGIEGINHFCEELGVSCMIHSTYQVPSLNKLMNVEKYYPIDGDAPYDKFKIESTALPPLYFDHKVAGSSSTYSTIYLDGVIPEDGEFGPLLKRLPSREKIEELARLYQG